MLIVSLAACGGKSSGFDDGDSSDPTDSTASPDSPDSTAPAAAEKDSNLAEVPAEKIIIKSDGLTADDVPGFLKKTVGTLEKFEVTGSRYADLDFLLTMECSDVSITLFNVLLGNYISNGGTADHDKTAEDTFFLTQAFDYVNGTKIEATFYKNTKIIKIVSDVKK